MSAWPPSGHVPELPPAARPPTMPAAPALRPPPPPATPAPPAPTRPAPPTPGKCPWRLSIGTPLWSEGATEADPTGLRCACVCACVVCVCALVQPLYTTGKLACKGVTAARAAPLSKQPERHSWKNTLGKCCKAAGGKRTEGAVND